MKARQHLERWAKARQPKEWIIIGVIIFAVIAVAVNYLIA